MKFDSVNNKRLENLSLKEELVVSNCQNFSISQIKTNSRIKFINCQNCFMGNSFVAIGKEATCGVEIEGCSNITIEKNKLSYCGNSIYVLESTEVVVNGNKSFNTIGPADPYGHAIQFDKCIGGKIINNISIARLNNTDFTPKVEDHISLFNSVGAIVVGNYISGGWSESGSGIIADGPKCKNLTIENNALLGTGQAGIIIAGGVNHSILNNKILDTNLYKKFPNAGNVGIGIFNSYGGKCFGHTVTGNIVSNLLEKGKFNDYWTDDSCGKIDFSKNIWSPESRPQLIKFFNKDIV